MRTAALESVDGDVGLVVVVVVGVGVCGGVVAVVAIVATGVVDAAGYAGAVFD
jgi:hypothetical protein